MALFRPSLASFGWPLDGKIGPSFGRKNAGRISFYCTIWASKWAREGGTNCCCCCCNNAPATKISARSFQSPALRAGRRAEWAPLCTLFTPRVAVLSWPQARPKLADNKPPGSS